MLLPMQRYLLGLVRISSTFTAGLNAAYDYYNNLYNGLRLGLNMSLDFPGIQLHKITIEIDNIKLFPLFPVLWSFTTATPCPGTMTGKQRLS